jgi:hypothetical protein
VIEVKYYCRLRAPRLRHGVSVPLRFTVIHPDYEMAGIPESFRGFSIVKLLLV